MISELHSFSMYGASWSSETESRLQTWLGDVHLCLWEGTLRISLKHHSESFFAELMNWSDDWTHFHDHDDVRAAEAVL